MSFGIDDPREDADVYVLANKQDEVIKFLFRQLWDLLANGDNPDLEKIQEMLKGVDIDPDELMVY